MRLLPARYSGNAALIGLWLHGRAASTQRSYTFYVQRFLAFAEHKPLNQVTLADLQDFADDLARPEAHLSTSTQNTMLSAIKSLFTFACKALPDHFKANPGAALHIPKARNDLAKRILPESDIQAMIAAEPDPRNHLLLALLYYTAIRRAELIGLCWGDVQERVIDGQTVGQITVFGKGSKTRAIVIDKLWLWRALADYRQGAPDEAPVFGIEATQVYTIVRKAAERVGIDKKVSPHWYRHAHASHAIDNGAPVTLVRDTLGHTNLATTSKYSHARPNANSGRYLR